MKLPPRIVRATGTAVAIALFGCMSIAQAQQSSEDEIGLQVAQSLPGPASGSWYVVMGVAVTLTLENAQPQNPQKAQELEDAKRAYAQMARQTMGGSCVAVVVPAQAANSTYVPFDAATNAIRMTKRFGPFSSAEAAYNELRRAGWNEARTHNTYHTLFIASSGC